MRIPTPTFAALLVALAATAPVLAQGEGPARFTITVRDAATGDPVGSATVQIGGLAQAGRTGSDGVWRTGRVAPGTRIVEVSRLGYAPGRIAVDFEPGANVERTLALTPEAVEVEGVTGSAERRNAMLEMHGFYGRERRGFGAFMGRERIERLRPSRTVDLFYHIRGFAVRRDRLGRPYIVSSRGTANLEEDCRAPLVFMDGSLISGVSSYLDFIQPDDIEAIEAYAGPSSVPIEYRRPGAACGVVLIWTKTGTR